MVKRLHLPSLLLFTVFLIMIYLSILIIHMFLSLNRDALIPPQGIAFQINTNAPLDNTLLESISSIPEPLLLFRYFSSGTTIAWISNRPFDHWFQVDAMPESSVKNSEAHYYFTARKSVVSRFGLSEEHFYSHHVEFPFGGYIKRSPTIKLPINARLLGLQHFFQYRDSFPLSGQYRILSNNPMEHINQLSRNLNRFVPVLIDIQHHSLIHHRRELIRLFLVLGLFALTLGLNVIMYIQVWSQKQAQSLNIHVLCGASQKQVFFLGLKSFSSIVLTAVVTAVSIHWVIHFYQFLHDPVFFTVSWILSGTVTYGVGFILFLSTLLELSRQTVDSSLRIPR